MHHFAKHIIDIVITLRLQLEKTPSSLHHDVKDAQQLDASGCLQRQHAVDNVADANEQDKLTGWIVTLEKFHRTLCRIVRLQLSMLV